MPILRMPPIFLLSILILISVSCNTSVQESKSNANSPTSELTSANANVSDYTPHYYVDIPLPAASEIPSDRQNTIEPAEIDREINNVRRTVLPYTRMTRLKRVAMAPNEIEVRIWELPSLYIGKTKCWVFARKDGQWDAFALVAPNFTGKIVKKHLIPSTDWLTWDDYVNKELTPTKIRGMGIDPPSGFDGGAIAVEVRFGNDYAQNLITNDDFGMELMKTIKSEFFNNDQESWGKM